eukprot:13493949-Ditylum_brightwellii.AAC.1
MSSMLSLQQWQLFLDANGTACKGNNDNGMVLRSKASNLHKIRRTLSLIVKWQKHTLALD